MGEIIRYVLSALCLVAVGCGDLDLIENLECTDQGLCPDQQTCDRKTWLCESAVESEPDPAPDNQDRPPDPELDEPTYRASIDIFQGLPGLAGYRLSWSNVGDNGCFRQEAGACSVTVCDPGREASEIPILNAGELSVTGGRVSLSMTPAESGRYRALEAEPGDESLWTARTTLRVQGAGNDSPAFDVQVTAPPNIELLEPAAAPTVDRSEDFAIAWTPPVDIEESTVAAYIVTYESTEAGFRIVSLGCAFDGAAGEGVFSKRLLEFLPAAPDLNQFGVSHEISSAFRLDREWEVSVKPWTRAITYESVPAVWSLDIL